MANLNFSASAYAGEDDTQLVLPPHPRTTLPVEGTDKRFPVRRVYCLGRNYSAHAIEMGDDPDKKPPFYFMKPSDAVYDAQHNFPYPSMSKEVGYEVEMVVALKSGGTNISEDQANQHVYAYGVGLDMTRRDIQQIAKDSGRPWEGAKSFDKSAPCSPLRPVSESGLKSEGRIWLSLNGKTRQESNISLMRWNIPKAISILSQYFELAAGDLIFTGTPAGVGLVEKGDVIKAGVEGVSEIEVHIL